MIYAAALNRGPAGVCSPAVGRPAVRTTMVIARE